jgi:ABC-type multidrug transport system fused ATPase/permease subunit
MSAHVTPKTLLPQGTAWSRLRFLLGGRPGQIALLVVISVIAGLMESAILTVVAQAASALVDDVKSVRISAGPLHLTEPLGGLLTAALVLALVRLALMAPVSILPARIAANVQARLRLNLFSAFTQASWSAQSRDREGHLQELMTNQVAQATVAALQAGQCLTAGITLLVLVLSALVLNALGAVFVLVAAVVLFGLLRPLNDLGARYSQSLSLVQMQFASDVGEATRLAEETYTFGVAKAQRARVEHAVSSARNLVFRTQMVGNLIPNFYRGLIYVIVVGGLAALNLAHSSHVASLGAVVLLLVRAGGYGQAAQGSYALVRQAMPYVDRVQGAERRYAANAQPSGDKRIAQVRSLAFEHVGFAYTPGRPVLSDISFEVERGEAIGIVGPSGAGKSTLIQILLRLRAPQGGGYLINDLPADAIANSAWTELVAYVPQEPRLLHASVAENIRYFRDLDTTAVEKAARLARIHDDVETWSLGYDTVIGPRADAISGGQQQRICIARALAGQPDLLVLDEPTSALDPQSENLLQDSLLVLKEQLTLVVIAHRMTTLELCDRVMVIVGGRMEAFGAASDLKQTNSYYRSASEISTGIVG